MLGDSTSPVREGTRPAHRPPLWLPCASSPGQVPTEPRSGRRDHVSHARLRAEPRIACPPPRQCVWLTGPAGESVTGSRKWLVINLHGPCTSSSGVSTESASPFPCPQTVSDGGGGCGHTEARLREMVVGRAERDRPPGLGFGRQTDNVF